jgi:outer membrane beta-barrel protein
MTLRWNVLPVILLMQPTLALAQDKPAEGGGQGEETFTVEETEGQAKPAEEENAPPVIIEDTETSSKAAATPDEKLQDTRVSWQDIVVVKHKPFLKMNRFELAPALARTINDNMIKHTALHAMANYYLTDVLAIGAEVLCIDICSGGLDQNPIGADFGETYRLVASQDRRLPTLNKYNFGAALNFHYSPIYAKFAVFNKKIVHLEGFFTAGVGFTQTEVIPRNPADQAWKNDFLITPNVGFTMRVFLYDWITLSLGVRDYIFIDKYENAGRPVNQPASEAMDDATTKLINHIMFNVGVSFWLPTSFEYRTFR